MKLVSTSNLISGMITSLNIEQNNSVIIPKGTILKDADVELIASLFGYNHKIWVFDLAEIQPMLLSKSNDILAKRYINFLVQNFRTIFTNTIQNKVVMEDLVNFISTYLYRYRNVLVGLVTLRGNHCYTYEHSMNVALYSMLIGLKLELSDKELVHLILGCILHDIGKIEISEAILDKPSRLEDDEFRAIQQHPLYGVRISNEICRSCKSVSNVILQHHEKLDGSGYPNHLSYDDISCLARIAAVADIFDAVTSERAYHARRPNKVGIDIIVGDSSKGKIGKEEVDALISQIVIYPINSVVQLNNGITGLVMQDCKSDRPIVYDYLSKSIFDLKKDKNLCVIKCVQ